MPIYADSNNGGSNGTMHKTIINRKASYVQFYRGHPVKVYNIKNPLPDATYYQWVSPECYPGSTKTGELNTIVGCQQVKITVNITSDEASGKIQFYNGNNELLKTVTINGWSAKTETFTIDLPTNGIYPKISNTSSSSVYPLIIMPEGRVTVTFTLIGLG